MQESILIIIHLIEEFKLNIFYPKLLLLKSDSIENWTIDSLIKVIPMCLVRPRGLTKFINIKNNKNN